MGQIQSHVTEAKMSEMHIQNLNTCLNDNFWIAYDALEPKNA